MIEEILDYLIKKNIKYADLVNYIENLDLEKEIEKEFKEDIEFIDESNLVCENIFIDQILTEKYRIRQSVKIGKIIQLLKKQEYELIKLGSDCIKKKWEIHEYFDDEDYDDFGHNFSAFFRDFENFGYLPHKKIPYLDINGNQVNLNVMEMILASMIYEFWGMGGEALEYMCLILTYTEKFFTLKEANNAVDAAKRILNLPPNKLTDEWNRLKKTSKFA
jgi:hypothetical protein